MTKTVQIFCAVAILLCFTVHCNSQRYSNPVIPGDFPDPSIIRVGADYYAATTTGGWSPPFTLLHSTDLVNWKVIGSVLEHKPVWAKGDFWAPEIINDNGKFRVYYTARRDDGKDKKGTLCVAVATAQTPAGPYADNGPLVCQEMGSIDAAFIRDEANKPFLIWKEDGNDRQQPTWLYAQELNSDGVKLIGKPKKLFRNTESWEKHVIEGPYVLYKNGWFYMFYSGNACCGRTCDYALGVARAKSLQGPWEKNPKNPILSPNQHWQCPGHGSIVSTEDGRSFLLYHAYRNKPTAFNIGREALLDQVRFENGWATINSNHGPSSQSEVPFNGSSQRSLDLNDEFNSGINPFWNYTISGRGEFRSENGFLLLRAASTPSEVVLAERTVSGDYTVSTRVLLNAPLQTTGYVGLAAYGWRQNAIGISFGSGKIYTWRRDNIPQIQLITLQLDASTPQSIILRMRVRDGESFRFAFSTDDGKNWEQIGEDVFKNDIEGARIALISSATSPDAKFDWIHVRQD
jgi:xylan 1,4-beta-xylosidase